MCNLGSVTTADIVVVIYFRGAGIYRIGEQRTNDDKLRVTDYRPSTQQYGMGNPKTYADFLGRRDDRILIHLDNPGPCLEYCLEFMLLNRKKPCIKPGDIDWCWFGALICLLSQQMLYNRKDLEYKRLHPVHDGDERLAQAADHLRACTEESIAQVEAFCDVFQIEGDDEIKPILTGLRRAATATLRTTANVATHVERRAAKRTMKLQELAMSESRSAIARK